MGRVVIGVGVVLALLIGLLVALPAATGLTETCSVQLDDRHVEDLTGEQVANSRIIVGTAAALRMPKRAAVIAIATAQQESRLRNLSYGDRDSLGLFQQRPSAGWGTPQRIRDPHYAATRFYRALGAVRGWQSMPLTVAAQAVQRSAFPNAYARWEPLAVRVVASLTGDSPDELTCDVDDAAASAPAPASRGGAQGRQSMDASGLTPRTRHAMEAVRNAFGVTNIGGYCPGGCRSGHIRGSDHYSGHAVDIMLTPINSANRRLGNRIAAWLVANAGRLSVKYVIWNERIWSRARADEGWRHYRHPSGSNNATLAHRDHVHLSIL
jgi:hypothetical protein